MTDFVQNTVNDMRGGRQSWRVIVSMSIPALVIAILLSTIQI
jgi:hypothetical protein